MRVAARCVVVVGTLVLLMTGIRTSAVARSGAEGVEIPETPAGRQVRAWLRAFHAGDAEVLLQFMKEQFAPSALQPLPVEERAQRAARLFQVTRGVAPQRIERSAETEIALLLQAKLTEEWLRLEVRVEPAPPHRVTHFAARPTLRPADAAPREKLSESQIAERVDAYVRKLAAADLFSGAVLVARNGKPIYKTAVGQAHKGLSVPNRVDTKFNLGSMNKMFTAVAIAQLAEQGKLSYTDTVGKHLPEYPNKEVAEKVTIHHLLTHTSGLGSYFNERFEARKNRIRTVADFLDLFAQEAGVFPPGERWEYSNSGFIVLGAIVEKLSGQEYYEYVRDRIYRPAGMSSTDSYELDEDVPNRAFGYTSTGMDGRTLSGHRRTNLALHGQRGGPAGGGYSTVEDLLRFDIALRGHRLLSASSTELILSGKAGTPWGAKYAYGFEADRVNGKRIVGHGGGFPGVNGQLDMYLDVGYTVAVLSNYDPPAAQRVADRLREMITQG